MDSKISDTSPPSKNPSVNPAAVQQASCEQGSISTPSDADAGDNSSDIFVVLDSNFGSSEETKPVLFTSDMCPSEVAHPLKDRGKRSISKENTPEEEYHTPPPAPRQLVDKSLLRKSSLNKADAEGAGECNLHFVTNAGFFFFFFFFLI